MKYLRQLAIILLLCIVGQLLSVLIGGKVPGNVLSMIVLFLLLLFRVIKVETIEETADFILANMAFFFIPACLGIVESYHLLAGNVIKLLIVCILTTILTSLSAGFTVKYILKLQQARRKKQ